MVSVHLSFFSQPKRGGEVGWSLDRSFQQRPPAVPFPEEELHYREVRKKVGEVLWRVVIGFLGRGVKGYLCFWNCWEGSQLWVHPAD